MTPPQSIQRTIRLTRSQITARREQARLWHLQNKPLFDAMDQMGAFTDSPGRVA